MSEAEEHVLRLDARGLHCPLPVLKAKKALASMKSGEQLEVSATDEDAVRDFEAFTKRYGHDLLRSERDGETYVFLIRKRNE